MVGSDTSDQLNPQDSSRYTAAAALCQLVLNCPANCATELSLRKSSSACHSPVEEGQAQEARQDTHASMALKARYGELLGSAELPCAASSCELMSVDARLGHGSVCFKSVNGASGSCDGQVRRELHTKLTGQAGLTKTSSAQLILNWPADCAPELSLRTSQLKKARLRKCAMQRMPLRAGCTIGQLLGSAELPGAARSCELMSVDARLGHGSMCFQERQWYKWQPQWPSQP